jgi:adenine-specific DNA-methyltransferase
MPTLDWLNRADAFTTSNKVPYRLLEQVSVHTSSVKAEPVEAGGIHDNLLIQGDNLEALKALLPFYRASVKCIFIDPPYNTKSAFEHYDDNLEHAQWLSMMLPRLQLLRELLREDGSIWVTIDDNEGHYLKVLMDEVFGRGNFVANIFWQKTHTRENRTDISAVHDHVLLFAKKRDGWKEIRNALPSSDEQLERFTNPDNDPRGVWSSLPAHAKAEKGRREAQFFTVTTPSGRKIDSPPGRCWLYTEPRFREMVEDGRIWFGENGTNAPRVKKFLTEVQEGLVPSTFWLHQEVGSNGRAKSELVGLFPGETPFSTPKPEALLQRILHIATNPNDLILDSFLGSGTTAAVAHKMGRRWIGIEMGEHAATHCLPRLQKVIDGEQGGISKAVGWGVASDSGEWKGGGGFRFMRLGETIFDDAGRINPAVRFATLAAFIWQQETGTAFDPATAKPGTPYLGTYYIISSYLCNIVEGQRPILLEIPEKTPQMEPKFSIYLLFNGILGDKRPASGNVLTRDVLAALLKLHAQLAPVNTPLVVYGESVRVGPARLAAAGVTFKQIPYDVRAR